MFFFGYCIMKTLSLLTVLLSSIIALSEASEEKKLNVRIGFDLTQGSNGVPSLRFRDFEDASELSPRAAEDTDEYSKPRPVVRADSFSDSDGNAPEDDDKPAENRKSDYEEAEYSGEAVRVRSTKGLESGDAQPEENPSVHVKYKGSGSESEDLRKRRKRQAGLYGILKKKVQKIAQRRKKKFSKL